MKRFLPVLHTFAGYDRTALRGDLSAGLTVGVMLIPQGMAYALIAGLPPIYGLYASLVPLVVYAAFGTSRQLAVGPVAMVSLLVAAGVAPLAGDDVGRYIELSLLLALMVGALQLGLGIARFGFLVNFLSHPVLSGFTSAAALIIGLSQLSHLLGLDIGRSNYIHEILVSAFRQAASIHGPTLLIGLGGIVLLVVLRRWKKTFPAPLVLVALGTLVVWLLGLSGAGVKIVGDVPGGLPLPVVPGIDPADLRALFPTALTIALVGFMESIAVAKVYAARNRYEVDANQELIGLGLANLVGAIFRAYPTTGGFSRTAVNAAAGARTPLAAVFSAGVIALTLLFLTPLFTFMPKAVLAAIVMVAVAGLFDWKEARFLWKADRTDFALMALTFVATLGLGIEEGILVGVAASIALVVYQSAQPHTAECGRLPGTQTYRNRARHPEAIAPEGVVVLRVDASFTFANAAYLKEAVTELTERTPRPRAVVLDMYPVNQIDSTAVHTLHAVLAELCARDMALMLAALKGPIRDRLDRAGFLTELGPNRTFLDVHEAVEAAEAGGVVDAKVEADPVAV